MQRAIVTGALGFLGRHLMRDLQQCGVRVTAVVRRGFVEGSYVAMGDAPWCSSRLARVIEEAEPEVIFHLAGGSVGSAVELQDVNVGLANCLMRALNATRMCPVLVCCGSAAEYGESILDGIAVRESDACIPISHYGAAKLAQTSAVLEFAQATGNPVLIARIFNLIGPGMPTYLALGDFARQIAMIRGSHGILETGNIDVCRDFIDVSHASGALMALAQNPDARGVVNVCSGRATALRKLVELLIRASAKKITIDTRPDRLRSREFAVVVGSTARLVQLGAAPPPTDFEDVVTRIWHDAALRWA